MKLSSFLVLASLGAATLVRAAVTADQAARLGQDLTPLGAERAGNAAGQGQHAAFEEAPPIDGDVVEKRRVIAMRQGQSS